MRSTNFSSWALLASLLVRDAFAAPLEKRDLVVEDVIISEVQMVTQQPDGSYKTGDAVAVGTTTLLRTPKAESTPVPSSSDAPIRNNAVSSVASSNAGGVFVEAPKSTSTTPPPPSPTPEPVTQAPEPAPTTLATVAASAVPSIIASVVEPVASAVASVVAPVTSTPASNGGSVSKSGKAGLAYNDASLLKNFLTAGSKTTWCYNWGSSTAAIPSGLEYVPMLWGLGEHVNNWKDTASKAISNGATHLLGYNEPDLGEQANISPQDAATGWSNMQQFAGQAKLGSPAVTNGGGAMGVGWLKSFLSACSSCTIDFVAFHWYDSASNFEYFKKHVSDVHDAAGGRPLWITEFGASGSVDEQNAFLKQAIEYLDSLDYVERYAYFMVQDGSLVSGGTLSTLGRTFAGLS